MNDDEITTQGDDRVLRNVKVMLVFRPCANSAASSDSGRRASSSNNFSASNAT